MSDLALPRPDNIRGYPGALIDSDVFHIAERLQELSPRLFVHLLDPPVQLASKTYNFAICELCDDGVERLVYRVEHLDGRVVEHCRYLLHVPFETRFSEAERLADKDEADFKEKELDTLYDRFGAPMLRQLEHDGFITHRGRSYAKRGVRPR